MWGKRFLAVMVGTVMLVPGLGSVSSGAATLPPEVPSPPGQVVVVTVNAKQVKVLGLATFRRLYNLTLTLRSRPPAFDGGLTEAVSTPDVIVIQEMTFSNLEIFQKMLNQRSKIDYEIAWQEGSRAKFLYNPASVAPVGDPVDWVDPCVPGPEGARTYQFARFLEQPTGLPLTIAGIHFLPHYRDPPTEGMNCRLLNVEEVRNQVADETGAVVVAGDFNGNAVTSQRECDVDERSEPRDWWTLMTSEREGAEPFLDAARTWHRERGLSMERQWTYGHRHLTTNCDGMMRPRRSRIDFLFASGALVAEASADDPGWAGEEPGSRHPVNKTYSDHRFVRGRFVLGGPARPLAPTASPARAGVVQLAWSPVDQAASYVVYRGLPGKPYAPLAHVDGVTTTYSDGATAHAQRYRYALAAVGADGAQGLESRPRWARADARGPRVIRVTPRSGASGVPRNSSIVVRFDEPFSTDAVSDSTIELVQKALWKKGRDRTIGGRVRTISARSIEFDPGSRLRDRRRFIVKVRALRDLLGNRGSSFRSSFST